MFEIMKTDSIDTIVEDHTKQSIIYNFKTGSMQATPLLSGIAPGHHIAISLCEDTWVYCLIPQHAALLICGFAGETEFVYDSNYYGISEGRGFYLADKESPQLFLFKAGQYQFFSFIGEIIKTKYNGFKRELLESINAYIGICTNS